MMPGLALIFGFLAASAALLVQVGLSVFITSPLSAAPSITTLLGAAAIEEGAKLLFLVQLGKRFLAPITFFSALIFGIGFVSAEIALLMLSASSEADFSALAAIILVQLAGTLVIYAGLRLREDFVLSPLLALLAAILAHTLYNSSL